MKPKVFLQIYKTVVLLLSLASVSFCAADGQETHPASLEGMSGTVNIVPNAGLRQVAIEFNSIVPRNPTSNQIIFVVQTELAAAPKAWSGSAQLLVGYGILIVRPEDSVVPQPILAFKFSEQPVPDSVKTWTMDTYSIDGISRYGESAPLTTAQVKQVEETGRFQPTVVPDSAFDAVISRITRIDVGGAGIQAKPDYAPPCQSGGPGSTSCSAGGASVSCKVGFYACCYGGGANCIAGN